MQKQPGACGGRVPHVVTVQHVFLDLWELSQHRSDVCHFRDPLHQPHLSQRNRDLETDLQAEGDHRRAFPVWKPDSLDSGIRPGGVWDAAAWPGMGGLGGWERLFPHRWGQG